MSDAPAAAAARGRPPSPSAPDHHSHAGASEKGAAPEVASVLVDVGDGRGALVLQLDESFRGREVEISRTGSQARVHTGALDRDTGRGRVLAAVFGSIAAGEYVVWRDEHTPAGTVAVPDGQVTQVRLDAEGIGPAS